MAATERPRRAEVAVAAAVVVSRQAGAAMAACSAVAAVADMFGRRPSLLTLVEDPWGALAHLCQSYQATGLDILTGYLGTGATRALAALSVRARIVVGLASEDAALSGAQIAEIRTLLAAGHDVRWLEGLHAKLDVVGKRAVLLGSANFTRSGFEVLDEIALATDDVNVVRQAIAAFGVRYDQAAPIDPDRLQPLHPSATDEGDPDTRGVGRAWENRASGFPPCPPRSQPAPVSGAPQRLSEGRGQDVSVVVAFDRDDFMYMNIAEGPHRCWEDCRRYGFVSAGQDAKWSRQLDRHHVGAPVYAYFKEHGYVGLGIVDGERRMASDHVVAAEGKRLFDLPLMQPGLQANAGDPANCEWVVPVRWYRTRNNYEAVGYGLFRSQHVACKLRDPATLQHLREHFERK